MTLPHIRAAVDRAMEARMKRLQAKADDVLIGLTLIAFANMKDYMSIGPDGAPRLDFSRLNRDHAFALAEVTVDEHTEGRGDAVQPVRRVRFKLLNKIRALELLGKHLGLFVDQVDYSGKGNLEAVRIVLQEPLPRTL